ncbi:MAG: hypothetical protein DBY16_05415 [Coprobacter sp.]|nr:MAG: hypothetical protein DBY16_05415 [Coprobacter sp.]
MQNNGFILILQIRTGFIFYVFLESATDKMQIKDNSFRSSGIWFSIITGFFVAYGWNTYGFCSYLCRSKRKPKRIEHGMAI